MSCKTEEYSELCQTSNIFAKRTMLDSWQGSEYTSLRLFCIATEISTTKVYPANKLQKQPSRGVLKKKWYSENMQQIYSEHPCRSVISIKMLCNFIGIPLWHGCSPVNLLHIFRTPFPKNTSEGYLGP